MGLYSIPKRENWDTVDWFKDTPVRFLGYCNEVGESLRPLVPRLFVHGTYAVSILYVLGDTYYSCIRKLKEDNHLIAQFPHIDGFSTKHLLSRVTDFQEKLIILGPSVAPVAFETLSRQILASIVIPGIVINRIVYFAKKLQLKGRYSPTIIGLASIPCIITYIDTSVDIFIDQTKKKIFNSDVLTN